MRNEGSFWLVFQWQFRLLSTLFAGTLASEPSFAFRGCQQASLLQAQHMQLRQQVDNVQQAAKTAAEQLSPAKRDCLQASTPQQLADHLAQLKQEFKDICSTVFDDDQLESDHPMHHSQVEASLLQQVVCTENMTWTVYSLLLCTHSAHLALNIPCSQHLLLSIHPPPDPFLSHNHAAVCVPVAQYKTCLSTRHPCLASAATFALY